MKHATRGTLSLQSLYLLLWANAGSFCIGLLTDASAEDKMKGSVFPEDLSIRSFCMKQLKTLWGHLSGSMGISVEERSFLVSRSMWNLLKVSFYTSVGIIVHSNVFDFFYFLTVCLWEWYNASWKVS